MTYKLQKLGAPILRKKVDRVLKFKPKELEQLFEEMVYIMILNQGIGLAANQIGLNKQIFIAALETSQGIITPRMFINPTMFTLSEQKYEAFEEGCLSVNKDKRISDFRSNSLSLHYQDTHGLVKTESFSGFNAVIIQHECDHLEGKLFIDYTNPHKC